VAITNTLIKETGKQLKDCNKIGPPGLQHAAGWTIQWQRCTC